ncbi:MAG: hypothetical protein ACRDY6_10615 [Acidimicrobiia bacterium]
MTIAVARPRARSRQDELEALAAFVGAFADHPQIRVVGGGVLEAPRDGHPAGTAFVSVVVPTVAAAEFAQEHLTDLARVTPDRWRHGWHLLERRQLVIEIYPDPDDADAEAFVVDYLGVRARRRPELEELVARRLTPDIAITDSGTEPDGAGYVEISVTSVDAAERAERALADLVDAAPEAWKTGWRDVGGRLSLRFCPRR